MNTRPVISCVIGSYNRKPFLHGTLECIRNNGITVPYEIIVVDGGSSDGSVSFLTRQRDVISIIQYNRGQWRGKKIERKSWGYFMNIGFRAAHGKYILMLSDDTLLVPGAIMNGYNLFENALAAGEKIGALAFYFRNYPGDKQYFVAKTLGDTMYVNHGLYLMEALKKINYLDEDNYFFYHGDADVCLRLKEAGYQTIASPNSFVEHFKHASGSNRASHTELHAKGWENFKNRWGHLVPDLSMLTEKNVNTKEHVDFTDTADTARYFRRTYAYWKYRAYLIALRIKKSLTAR